MAEQKQFPVIPDLRNTVPHPMWIPWSVAELAYSVYTSRYGKQQLIERLCVRGGFHVSELDEYVPDWRERSSEVTALRQEIERLKGDVKRLSDCLVHQREGQCDE